LGLKFSPSDNSRKFMAIRVLQLINPQKTMNLEGYENIQTYIN
jgi:hypothetical protein